MDKERQLQKVNVHLPGYKTLKYFILLTNKLNETRRCHARQEKRDGWLTDHLREKSLRNKVLRKATCIRTLITPIANSLYPLID